MVNVKIEYIVSNPDKHIEAVDSLIEVADALNEGGEYPYWVDYAEATVSVKLATHVIGAFEADGLASGEKLQQLVESRISPESREKIQSSFAGFVLPRELIRE